jgi:DNA-binding transcriptional ArsR family regulator
MRVSVSVVGGAWGMFHHADPLLAYFLLLAECAAQAQYATVRAHNNMTAVSASQQPAEAERLVVGAEVLSLLADPTRLHLLRLLAYGEQDVTTLAAQVTASRSSVSQHLGRLRLAGLVQARRDGRRMLYRTTSDHLSALVDEALAFADHIVRGFPHHQVDAVLPDR